MRKFIPLIFLFALNIQSHAHDKIDVLVENTCYDIETRLSGSVIYEGERHVQEVSHVIPAHSDQKLSPIFHFTIPYGTISALSFILTTYSGNDEKDKVATLIAGLTMTQTSLKTEALKITIAFQRMKIEDIKNKIAISPEKTNL